ncbi:MAG: prolyl oligopeptidase family serine peptidase [Clostridia bacterium]|nr:prolyl oligopeptidase family serine peptidase [Clostridia bacterium]
MKRTIAVLLSAIFVLSCVSMAASALSMSAGTEALDACFIDGKFNNGFDYVYFSPKKGEGDTTKYPLMVWLHGMQSGKEKRAQLKWYEFSNWASDEYQSRFYNGGCYLLAVRASDSIINSWNGDDSPKLKATVNYFVSQNEGNIDTDRIYLGGYSTGGLMVWDAIAQFPGYFAAAIPIASTDQPTKEELSKLGETAVWIFSSDHDPYQLSESSDVQPVFNYLKANTKKPESVRWTRVSDQRFADGSKRYDLNTGKTMWDAEHFIWESVTYDMHMNDGVTPYVYTTTVDATGKTITFEDPNNGVISWLAKQTKGNKTSNSDTTFWSRIQAFFQKIADFFKNLFKF